jgi:nicotinate-nucleotide adenylyltransferase
MAVLATEADDALFVSDIELKRESLSYTVETLETLRAADPDSVFDWIIGDDNLARLMEWRDVDRILELANFAVLDRSAGGSGELVPEPIRDRVMDPAARGKAGAVTFAANPAVTVSSTEIRRRSRAGEDFDAFVDPRVARYIQHYRLYK